MELTFQRCLVHGDRQAIARCPACTNYFCRECITEHEGKFLCSNCLERKSIGANFVRRNSGWLAAIIGLIMGLSVAWFFFYLIGRLLLLIPPNLHDFR
jgi:hypothetical protein